MARTTITQVNQLGVETTAGTAVTGSKKLQSMSFMLNPNPEVQMFRPTGSKFPTVGALGKEWSTIDIEGQPTFDEIIYALSSVLTAAVVTTPGGGTLSRDWTFTPATSADDAPKTYTIEQGSSVRAARAAYCIFTGMTISYENGRENVAVSGEGIGRVMEDGVTLTAAPTSLPLVPILAKDTTFYLDSTSAGLGTTILGGTPGAVGAEMAISNRYGPRWGYNAANASYSEHLELEPTDTVKFTVEGNAAGLAYLANLRAGDTRFFRAQTTGPIIEGVITYKLRWDAAIKFSSVGKFEDEDGLYAIEFTGTVVHDAGWGKSQVAVVTCTQTAL